MPPELQFEKAAYGGEIPLLTRCTWCTRGIPAGEAADANGSLICVECAVRARAVIPDDGWKVLWRAVTWGALAAVSSSLVLIVAMRVASTSVFGWVVYIVAVLAGLVVGKTMRKAAQGAGGRRFQVAAALLTYVAITVGMSAAMEATDIPWYAYPFMVLFPVVRVFLPDMRQVALWELFIAFIGMRWSWGQLPAWPLTITAPAERTQLEAKAKK